MSPLSKSVIKMSRQGKPTQPLSVSEIPTGSGKIISLTTRCYGYDDSIAM